MNFHAIASAVTWFYLSYFIAINFFYLFLNIVSFFAIRRYVQWRALHTLPRVYGGFEIPITILVPAYNESATIADSVRSLLQLDYPEYEIVVVNDGSKDDTLEVLKKEFSLKPFPEATQARLKTQPVRGTYISTRYPNLKVIDKENGGKADSLNAGINSARHPLFCCIDSDSLLQRESLKQVVQPFLDDPTTIAAGGTVRIANGCRVDKGFMLGAGLPRNYLGLMQIVEYLRAFLFGRMGWSPLNCILIISGAFGLFKKEIVLEAGGYLTNTVGEDMELVVRLHRHMRLRGKPYRISFVPDPICWTEAPQSFRVLKNQRIRWQRGLCEALWLNRSLLFNARGGAVSWVAYPFMLFFEALEPLIQVSGYVLTLTFFSMGAISSEVLISFLVVMVGLGVLLSVNALMLEEISFHIYPGFRQSFVLFLFSLIENLGYRQLNSFWRLIGFFQWVFRSKAKWGHMARQGIGNPQVLKSCILTFLSVVLIAGSAAASPHRDRLMAKAAQADMRRDFIASRGIYFKILKKNPADLEAKTRLAFATAWIGDYVKARALFEEVLSASPGNRDALLGRASVFYWQGDRVAARNDVDELLQKNPNDAEAAALREKILKSEGAGSKDAWKVRAGYEFQHITFAPDAHGFSASAQYDRKKEWSLQGAYRHLRKFGDEAHQGSLGAGFWAAPNTHFLLESTFAPGQAILPNQSYSAEIDQIFWKVLVPFARYRFADYRSVDVHDFQVGLTWYFLPHWAVQGRYAPSIDDFGTRSETNHSMAFQAIWDPLDHLGVFAGYARSEESFDSGNPVTPIGSFSAQHGFGGVRWRFYKGFGVDVSVDYEKRSTGASLTYVDAGLTYEW